jgi:hypothetical protein
VTTDPYIRFVELAEREHDALIAGDIEELAPINTERLELMAELPVRPPDEARPVIAEAARLQARNTALLEAAKARISARLAASGRTRDTVRGYARQVAVPGPNFFRSA